MTYAIDRIILYYLSILLNDVVSFLICGRLTNQIMLNFNPENNGLYRRLFDFHSDDASD